MHHNLLFVIILLTFGTFTSANILDDPFGWLGGVLDDIIGPSVDHASQAIRELMDDIFEQRIDPLINKINNLINTDIAEIDENLNRLADKIQTDIQQDIKILFDRANELINHTIEEIKEQLLDQAFTYMTKLETQTFDDVNKILDRIALLVDKVDCTLISTADNIIDEIKEAMYEFLPNPLEYCRGQLTSEWPWFRWTPVAEMSILQLYKLQKCRSLEYITENSLIAQVCDAYLDIESYASKSRCISSAMTAPGTVSDLETFFLKELATSSLTYKAYCNNQKNQSRRKKNNINDDACGTPVECYAQAVLMLKKATSDIDDIKTRASNIEKYAKETEMMANVTANDALKALNMSTSAITIAQQILNYTPLIQQAFNHRCKVEDAAFKCPDELPYSISNFGGFNGPLFQLCCNWLY